MPDASGQTGGDAAARRRAVVCADNPRHGGDYLVELRQRRDGVSIAGQVQPFGLCICYVPDRAILSPTALAGYLDVVLAAAWPSLEALCGAILDDLGNELICRWLSLRLSVEGHMVLAEDRQPNWRNEALERAGAMMLQRGA